MSHFSSKIDETKNDTCEYAEWNDTYTTLAGTYSNADNTTWLLNTPYDIFVDNYDNLYVADTNNNRILRFSSGKIFYIQTELNLQLVFLQDP